jgi:hypothetical protein
MISINDADKRIFDDDEHRLTKSGIQTWMAWGLFWPAVKAEARDPLGCELDDADLTALSIFRRLSYAGVRLRSFSARTKSKVALPDQLAVRFSFDKAGLTRDQKQLLDSNRADKRPFQSYFEWHNYNVWIEVTTDILKGPKRSSIPMSRVRFFPETALAENLDRMIDNPGFSSHSFIAVRPHYEYIRGKLQIMGA